MSKRDEIFEAVKESIHNIGSDTSKLSMESHLVDDVGLDSLDGVQLVMDMEERYGIAIDDSDAESFKRVEDVVNYIQKKLQ